MFDEMLFRELGKRFLRNAMLVGKRPFKDLELADELHALIHIIFKKELMMSAQC